MATENYLLSIQGSVNGQYNECVQCFQSSGVTSTDTLDAATDLITAWIAHAKSFWLAMFPNSYVLDLLTARRAFPSPSAVAYQQFQYFVETGTRGASATAYNICPSVFLIPPMGVKTGGRTFLPAVSASDIVNNAPISAYTTAVQSYFTAAISGLAGSGTNWQLGIFSRKNTSVSLVASSQLSPRIGFQSRRRRPVGSA